MLHLTWNRPQRSRKHRFSNKFSAQVQELKFSFRLIMSWWKRIWQRRRIPMKWMMIKSIRSRWRHQLSLMEDSLSLLLRIWTLFTIKRLGRTLRNSLSIIFRVWIQHKCRRSCNNSWKKWLRTLSLSSINLRCCNPAKSLKSSHSRFQRPISTPV